MQLYGGDFPWVGVKYELRMMNSVSPLQLLNKLSQKLLLPRVIVMYSGGGFRRAEDLEPLFPFGGMDLRWRWDAAQSRIVIDFLTDGKVLQWRWDEFMPAKEFNWASLVPDWDCIGHVGTATFEYKLTAISDAIPPIMSQVCLVDDLKDKDHLRDDLAASRSSCITTSMPTIDETQPFMTKVPVTSQVSLLMSGWLWSTRIQSRRS